MTPAEVFASLLQGAARSDNLIKGMMHLGQLFQFKQLEISVPAIFGTVLT